MALVKSNSETDVIVKIDHHQIVVGTEPTEIPDALLEAVLSQNCVEVKTTKKPTPAKPE